MIIAITGGTGFIGRRLVAKHLEAGNSVRVLTRRDTSYLPDGAVRFIGDLADPSFNPVEFVRGVAIVHNCVGELRDESVMRALHVDGTQRLLDASLLESARTGQKMHWVQLSSVGAYGPPRNPAVDRIVNEETAPRPVGEYEVTKTDADELVARASRSGLITYTIVRPSNVFGAEMTNQSLQGLVQIVKRGLFFYIGNPGAVATYVHVDDVVAALMKCASEPMAKGQIFNLSNDCLLEELVEHISASLGVRRPWLRLPEMLVRSTVSLLEGFVTMPLTQSRVDALVKRTRYPADKIVSELDFAFSKPMPSAIDDLIPRRSEGQNLTGKMT